MKRLRLKIQGCVQGVGFRPFVYRIANQLNLSGFVRNTPEGVLIEIEGEEKLLEEFTKKLEKEKSHLTTYHSFESCEIKLKKEKEFRIAESENKGERDSFILPDIATCRYCRSEIFDNTDRRYFYPFTNCTLCGPRFSIVESLPYDRKNTSMKTFKMCKSCEKEYNNPADRRFHAQPNACPECGPKIQLLSRKGKVIAGENIVLKSAELIKKGKILALKCLGGYQLIVDARNEAAVSKLREIKKRNEKPFAVMFPDLKVLKEYVYLTNSEKEFLESYQAPIVLLKRRRTLAKSVAPENSYIGALFPYTPLHHVLMSELNIPIVCTSGNISDEPIIIDNKEAILNLKADYFLIHDRPIKRPVDDSVVRVIGDKKLIIRRARGFAPLPMIVGQELPNILAVGAHLKTTIAISKKNKIFVSQHIGDMETEKTFKLFVRTIKDFKRIYKINPEFIVCDMHPDYLTTKFACSVSKSENLKLVKVYHHHSHIASCMLDNNLDCRVLGVAWDGTGYGADRTIWGGEFLLCDYKNFERVASFRPFYLIGGERAIKEPRRILLSIFYEIYGEDCFDHEIIKTKFSGQELKVLNKMINNNIMLFKTSSAGRLFDSVASILNLKQVASFEGQAAMMVESIARDVKGSYSFKIRKSNMWFIDWKSVFIEIIEDIKNKTSKEVIAGKFHNTLVEAIREIAKKIKIKKIVLSGGCFQNVCLTKKAIANLKEDFEIYVHNNLPPNDAGISAGQIAIAAKLCA